MVYSSLSWLSFARVAKFINASDHYALFLLARILLADERSKQVILGIAERFLNDSSKIELSSKRY